MDSLLPSQAAGLLVLVGAWITRYPNRDVRHLAYCLATAAHETGHTMQPVAEIGLGRGHSYGVPDPITGETYYGRGYVQITHKDNYDRIGRRLGIDLVRNPRLALMPPTAAEILFVGMVEGLFTGLSLSHFFNATTDDPVGARRIVNGADCADRIAALHRAFVATLVPAPAPAPAPTAQA